MKREIKAENGAELKGACQKCGGDAEFDYYGVPDEQHSITCTKCNLQMPFFCPTKEQAVSEWLKKGAVDEWESEYPK